MVEFLIEVDLGVEMQPPIYKSKAIDNKLGSPSTLGNSL